MPGTGAGWDSILYKSYIVGGILGIVAVALVVGYLDPTGQGPYWIPMIFGSITLWMAGFLGFWWVKLLFGGCGEPERWVEEDGDDTPAVKVLSSWSKLSEAMTVHGGDVAELEKLEKAARRPVLEWYGWTNVIVFYCLGGDCNAKRTARLRCGRALTGACLRRASYGDGAPVKRRIIG